MTTQCRSCLVVAFLNCVGLCAACDDRMKDAYPEGMVAVPVSVVRELQVHSARVGAAIEKTDQTIETMRRDLQAAMERIKG